MAVDVTYQQGVVEIRQDGNLYVPTGRSIIVEAGATIDSSAGTSIETTSMTLTTPVITGGLTASGSGANDFSASTGTFKTSTGINTIGGLMALPAADALTAVGTTQAGALALTKEVNAIGTAAAATAPFNGVTLPASVAGYDVLVINAAANPIQVYGLAADTINGQTNTVGVTQPPNSVVLYCCSLAGIWRTEGIGGGFAGSLGTVYTTPAITAFSGGGQGSAIALVAGYNRVNVVAAQGDSVKLPASAVGLFVTLNNQGANACQVFGAGTDTINGIATATGVSHGVKQVATYFCAVAGNWDVQFGQPQQAGIVALSVNGAIPPHVAHTYVISKAGVLADTLAAPTAGTDDGLIITITSDTANAHTLTATGLLDTGTASVNLATFAAQKGAGLTLMAYNGRWKVLAAVGITFS